MRDAGRYTCVDPAQMATNLFARDYSLIVRRKSVNVYNWLISLLNCPYVANTTPTCTAYVYGDYRTTIVTIDVLYVWMVIIGMQMSC